MFLSFFMKFLIFLHFFHWFSHHLLCLHLSLKLLKLQHLLHHWLLLLCCWCLYRMTKRLEDRTLLFCKELKYLNRRCFNCCLIMRNTVCSDFMLSRIDSIVKLINWINEAEVASIKIIIFRTLPSLHKLSLRLFRTLYSFHLNMMLLQKLASLMFWLLCRCWILFWYRWALYLVISLSWYLRIECWLFLDLKSFTIHLYLKCKLNYACLKLTVMIIH